MNYLAIDTATEACSAALWCDGEMRDRFQLTRREHTQLILNMVDDLVAEAGLSPSQLDGVAFNRGPGSFVGLRIGTGVAQGIAYAHDLPVVGVSSLAALAWLAASGKPHCNVLTAIDARMGEVYWGAYRTTETGCTIEIEEQVVAPGQVALPRNDDVSWLIAGTGWEAYSDVLHTRCQLVLGSDNWQPEITLPHARAVLQLAQPILQDSKGVSAAYAQPVYLRNKVAETVQERRQKNGR